MKAGIIGSATGDVADLARSSDKECASRVEPRGAKKLTAGAVVHDRYRSHHRAGGRRRRCDHLHVRSKFGRQIAVDFETDADFHERWGRPGDLNSSRWAPWIGTVKPCPLDTVQSNFFGQSIRISYKHASASFAISRHSRVTAISGARSRNARSASAVDAIFAGSKRGVRPRSGTVAQARPRSGSKSPDAHQTFSVPSVTLPTAPGAQTRF
jgi:hypothetical protein